MSQHGALDACKKKELGRPPFTNSTLQLLTTFDYTTFDYMSFCSAPTAALSHHAGTSSRLE